MAEQMNEPVGPYERWALGAGARYTLGPEISASRYVAGVAELPAWPNPRARQQAKAGSGDACVHLPTLWKDAFGHGKRVFCPLVFDLGRRPSVEEASAFISSRLSELRTSFEGAAAFSFRVNAPIPETAVNPGFVDQAVEEQYEKPSPSGRSRMAIMAIIDDGIPFAHRNLRDKHNRSRVEFCWLQGAQAGTPREKPTVLFGEEYTADRINKLIAEQGHDEDALYRSVLTERHVYPGATINLLATHGAHVLDVAAGHRHGTAPTSARLVGPRGDLDALRVIAVQLPASVTRDTTGFGKDGFILSAFHYIFDRADRVAQKYLSPGRHLPLIINFSYGFSGGPHNGRDRLERAIRALIHRRADTRLVMPSGNDFLGALHGTITENTLEHYSRRDRSFEIPWRVQPNDRTPNYLEIWFPQGESPEGISIDILDPAVGPVYREKIEGTKARNSSIGPESRPIGQFSIEHYRTGEGKKDALWRMVIALAPTEPDDPIAPAARPGLWRVKLQIPAVMKAGPISCRIQRDNDPFGYARGARQSYFDDRLDEPFEPSGRRPRGENLEGVFVRRFGTLNGLATHDAVTVVGGCVAASEQPADYSSAGSVGKTAGRPGSVHYSAPSETSSTIAGILAGGTRSGVVFRMTGTSTAAPQISRKLAVDRLTAPAAEPDAESAAKPATSALKLGATSTAKQPTPDLLQGITPTPGGDRESKARLGKGLLLPQSEVQRSESPKGG